MDVTGITNLSWAFAISSSSAGLEAEVCTWHRFLAVRSVMVHCSVAYFIPFTPVSAGNSARNPEERSIRVYSKGRMHGQVF